MSQPRDAGRPSKRDRATRAHELRQRGLTWEQIAAVWESDYPQTNPRIAFRWAHNVTHQEIAEYWNRLDPGEPTMSRSRIYEFEAWPERGRRPNLRSLKLFARIYQTTGRRLLTDKEYSLFDRATQKSIEEIDERKHDENQVPYIRNRQVITPTAGDITNPGRQIRSTARVGVAGQYSPQSDIAIIEGFRVADRQIGGGHVYPAVIGYLQTTIAPRMFGNSKADDSDRIFTTAGALSEMAGWMAHDVGDNVTAERHFRRSLDLAMMGSDHQLRAHILASMSHLSLHGGNPKEAIELAKRGRLELVSISSNPGLMARLHAMEARGLAAMNRSIECDEILGLAEGTLGGQSTETPSPWISRFDEGSLASEAARCMRQLSRLADAEAHARRIISLRPGHHTRSRAFAQLLLIDVLIAQGRPDEGCSIAQEVLEATHSLGSYLVLEQLNMLQIRLAPFRAERMVAEFLAHLRDVLPTRLAPYQDDGDCATFEET